MDMQEIITKINNTLHFKDYSVFALKKHAMY